MILYTILGYTTKPHAKYPKVSILLLEVLLATMEAMPC